MVENINKLPEPEEFEDPKILNKDKRRQQSAGAKKSINANASTRSASKLDLNKSAVSRNNGGNNSQMSNHDSPKKSTLGLRKLSSSSNNGSRTPSKLLLTNQKSKKKNDFDKFTMPATFETKYGQFMVDKQNGHN